MVASALMTVSQAIPLTPVPVSLASQAGDATWVSHWDPGGSKVPTDHPIPHHSPTRWSYARFRGDTAGPAVALGSKISVHMMSKPMVATGFGYAAVSVIAAAPSHSKLRPVWDWGLVCPSPLPKALAIPSQFPLLRPQPAPCFRCERVCFPPLSEWWDLHPWCQQLQLPVPSRLQGTHL